MNTNSKVDLAALLVVLLCEIIALIPAVRLRDSRLPGLYAGFMLMAGWLYLVVPGAAVLAAAANLFLPARFGAGTHRQDDSSWPSGPSTISV